MPDAAGNFKPIAVPALPWVKTTKVACGCDECRCDVEALQYLDERLAGVTEDEVRAAFQEAESPAGNDEAN